MKTTLDLPPALVKQVKLRALRDGLKLKDAVADLLQKGLAAVKPSNRHVGGPSVTKDKRTGLPLIRCKPAASEGEELTPERVAEILLAQETDWNHAARR